MTDSPRAYRSTLRDEQARATRRRIVDAGRDLFIQQGYARTTIDAIAARAEVSRKTVFTSVGSKAGLLKLAFDWTLAGDDEPVPMADRPEVRRLREERDPAEVIAQWSRINAAVACRLALLFHVLAVAADGDEEAAEVLAVAEQNRRGGAQVFVDQLHAIGGLRADLALDRASAVAEVLMDPNPARRLVIDAGWTLEEYAAYVERMAVAAFLPREAPSSGTA